MPRALAQAEVFARVLHDVPEPICMEPAAVEPRHAGQIPQELEVEQFAPRVGLDPILMRRAGEARLDHDAFPVDFRFVDVLDVAPAEVLPVLGLDVVPRPNRPVRRRRGVAREPGKDAVDAGERIRRRDGGVGEGVGCRGTLGEEADCDAAQSHSYLLLHRTNGLIQAAQFRPFAGSPN